MSVYIVTGKLGNGKSLVSVARIRDKIRAGCVVATNLDINLRAMFGSKARNCHVMRLPDKPDLCDLEAIGVGNETYDESQNGLLVLDECGTWFNARNWQDKSRKAVNDWFLHSRKLGWDVILIVQDISIIDSQARDTISEHTVFCRRLDKLRVPFLGAITKAVFGFPLKFPLVHTAKVVYGTTLADMVADRWTYRGHDLYACYDTKQKFTSDYPHGAHSLLTPWHVYARNQNPRRKGFHMRLTRVIWKRFKSPLAFGTGALLGASMTVAVFFGGMYREMKAKPVATIAVNAPVAKVEDVDPMIAKLKKLRIVGSANINGEFKYRFVDADDKTTDPEKRTTYSSDDLVKMVVTIYGQTDCFARLAYGKQFVDSYCI